MKKIISLSLLLVFLFCGIAQAGEKEESLQLLSEYKSARAKISSTMDYSRFVIIKENLSDKFYSSNINNKFVNSAFYDLQDLYDDMYYVWKWGITTSMPVDKDTLQRLSKNYPKLENVSYGDNNGVIVACYIFEYAKLLEDKVENKIKEQYK